MGIVVLVSSVASGVTSRTGASGRGSLLTIRLGLVDGFEVLCRQARRGRAARRCLEVESGAPEMDRRRQPLSATMTHVLLHRDATIFACGGRWRCRRSPRDAAAGPSAAAMCRRRRRLMPGRPRVGWALSTARSRGSRGRCAGLRRGPCHQAGRIEQPRRGRGRSPPGGAVARGSDRAGPAPARRTSGTWRQTHSPCSRRS